MKQLQHTISNALLSSNFSSSQFGGITDIDSQKYMQDTYQKLVNDKTTLAFVLNLDETATQDIDGTYVKDIQPQQIWDNIAIDPQSSKVSGAASFKTFEYVLADLLDGALKSHDYMYSKHKYLLVLQNCIFNNIDYQINDDQSVYSYLLQYKDTLCAPAYLFKEYADSELKKLASREDFMLSDIMNAMMGKTRQCGLGHGNIPSANDDIMIRGCDDISDRNIRRMMYYYIHTYVPQKDENININTSLLATLLYGSDHIKADHYFTPKQVNIDCPVNRIIDGNVETMSFRRLLMIAYLSLIFTPEYDEFKKIKRDQNINIMYENATAFEIQLDEQHVMSVAKNKKTVTIQRYEPASVTKKIKDYDREHSYIYHIDGSNNLIHQKYRNNQWQKSLF